jgi:hypothetical protein
MPKAENQQKPAGSTLEKAKQPKLLSLNMDSTLTTGGCCAGSK